MKKKSNLKGWFITLTGALFFFYAFIQANVMTPLNGELLNEFKVGTGTISLVSAFYFYANILFIIPAGLALDRISVKKLMLFGLFLAILGTLVFSFADSLFFIGFGRFLSGIMMAFGLVGCLKLASIWLPPHRMAIASSLVVTIGMLGGIFAQTPMALLIQNFGWRKALIVLAMLGVIIGIILSFVIKEPKVAKKTRGESVLISLKNVFKLKANWYLGFFISLLNFPVAILGALFGISYLMQTKGFNYLEASTVVSMLFFGMIVGSPFFGAVSDSVRKRKIPIYIGAIFCLFFTSLLIFNENISYFFGYVLFFLIGFTSASQVLGYPMITENNSEKNIGTALSLAAFIIMGLGYGIGLPFVGWLLESIGGCKLVEGGHVYSTSVYKIAFLTLPIAIFIGILMVMFTKETNCKSIYKK